MILWCVHFWQSFCKFLTFDTQKIARQLTCTILNLACSTTCEEKKQNHAWIDTLEFEKTRHILLDIPKNWGDILNEWNVDVDWHSFFVFGNFMWDLGFVIERQMKFVVHTCWLPIERSNKLNPIMNIGPSNICPVDNTLRKLTSPSSHQSYFFDLFMTLMLSLVRLLSIKNPITKGGWWHVITL